MAGSATLRMKAQPTVRTHRINTPTRRLHTSPRVARRSVTVRAGLLPEVDAITLTYAGLSSAAVAFLGTFFLIPQFKDSFKEDLNWKEIHRQLVKAGVKSVTPAEAYEKAKRGAVLLDVRMSGRFDDADKAVGSINIPLYQPIQNWDIASNLRRIGFAFFGVYGTELNENFLAEVVETVPTSSEVIVMCDVGGTVKSKVGAPNGFQSRSLKALYFLQQNGYKKVYHLDGGISRWFREGLPAEEEDESISSETAAAFSFANLFGRK